jgi:hypothetical protein
MVVDSDVKEALAEAIADSDFVRVHRDLPDDTRIACYVETMGDTLVLVQPFFDFFPEGWAVIRLQDVVEVEYDDHEIVLGAMLHAEGIHRQTHPFPLELGSIGALLRQLHERGCPVIIEAEGPDPQEQLATFTLGSIESIDDLRVHMRAIDAAARYETELVRIPLRDITKVQIGAPYLKNFVKYASWPDKAGKGDGPAGEGNGVT